MNFKSILMILSVFMFAQQTLAQDTSNDLKGSWIVVVDGESRTRTLNIIGAEQEPVGSGAISAEYGWTDGKKSSLKAKVARNSSGENELSFTTGAGSKVTVVQKGPGLFEGRIINGDDYNKKITIASEEKAKQFSLVPQKPGEDVPTSCANLFGSWRGYWTMWGVSGERILHITKVTSECGIEFFYYPDATKTTNFPGASKVQNDVFSFLCNKDLNGTCEFKIRGNEMWVNYTEPGGGTNSGVFKKQQ